MLLWVHIWKGCQVLTHSPASWAVCAARAVFREGGCGASSDVNVLLQVVISAVTSIVQITRITFSVHSSRTVAPHAGSHAPRSASASQSTSCSVHVPAGQTGCACSVRPRSALTHSAGGG